MAIKYKRVLIKVSGEALAGDDRFGVNDAELGKVAAQIKEISDAGVEVAVVVGGGNFFRGRTGGNIDKPTADYMGMLATVMNGLAVQDALLAAGCPAKLMTAIEIRDMAEGYARRKALDYLEEGKVVVFVHMVVFRALLLVLRPRRRHEVGHVQRSEELFPADLLPFDLKDRHGILGIGLIKIRKLYDRAIVEREHEGIAFFGKRSLIYGKIKDDLVIGTAGERHVSADNGIGRDVTGRTRRQSIEC